MSEDLISVAEFKERIVAVCRGKNAGFPRKQRDRHIIYRSIVQTLRSAQQYSEQSLNDALRQWIMDVGPSMDIDHVTLRRYLVDNTYLQRDPLGASYRVNEAGRGEVQFHPAVNDLDISAILTEADEEALLRKRKWVNSGTHP
jgi:hypothetical protein